MLKTFGVEHAMQNRDVFAAAVETGMRGHKSFSYPSGKTIRIQGYEGVAINYLLREGFAESDIITERNRIPSVAYNRAGEQRYHHPDILLAGLAHFVEVKSQWTFELDAVKLECVRPAARQMGYKYTIIVCNRREVKAILGDSI